MAQIEDIILRLLPRGSNPRTSEPDSNNWDNVPLWPPDLFAVTATIVELSGCYTDARYSCKAGPDYYFGTKYLARVRKAAREWAKDQHPPSRVKRLWSIMLRNGSISILDRSQIWRDAAIELLAIADETCAGIGFSDDDTDEDFADLARLLHIASLKAKDERFLNSLCIAVPPEEACVQPKSLTSQVGCTIRSLTHHLALLPPISQVRTKWSVASEGQSSEDALNLLLVPFPYHIDSSSFVDMGPIHDDGGRSAHFQMQQTWIPKGKTDSEIAEFFLSLIAISERDHKTIHGLVLPELALSLKCAQNVAKILNRKSNLEFFVSGVLASSNESPLSRNEAFFAIFKNDKKNFLTWSQSKHHRWKIEANQIRRYQLENRLDPRKIWWEQIDIADRGSNFYVFRAGASMAVLVCEDLARIDPIQPVLRSVGPNLVIALLQDGPQTVSRWSSRYATVLSDDPGSGVLSLTSQGMVDRSMLPTDTDFRRVIALWKDPVSGTKEVTLKNHEAAVVLKLSFIKDKSWTLDGRCCGGEARRLTLDGAYSIAADTIPPWIKGISK